MTESVERRLGALSRSVRAWQLATLASVALAVAALATSLASRRASEIEATAFIVVDESGEEVARLENARGGPRLELRAPEAGARILLGSFAQDAALAFISGDALRVNLGVGQNGFPGLVLNDRDGKQRVVLGVDEHEVAAVTLSGRDRGERLVLRPERDSALRVVDENGAAVVAFPPRRRGAGDPRER